MPPGLIPAGKSGSSPAAARVEDGRFPGSAGIGRDPLAFLGVRDQSLERNSRCSALPDRAWSIPGCPSFPCGSDPSWWIRDPGAEAGATAIRVRYLDCPGKGRNSQESPSSEGLGCSGSPEAAADSSFLGIPEASRGAEQALGWFVPDFPSSLPRIPGIHLGSSEQFPALPERDRETGGCWGDLVAPVGAPGSLVADQGSLPADQGSLEVDQGSFLLVDQEFQPLHELRSARGRELGPEDQRGD